MHVKYKREMVKKSLSRIWLSKFKTSDKLDTGINNFKEMHTVEISQTVVKKPTLAKKAALNCKISHDLKINISKQECKDGYTLALWHLDKVIMFKSVLFSAAYKFVNNDFTITAQIFACSLANFYRR